MARGHEESALRQMVRVLQRYVAMAPDQWCNFYDVWDAKPSNRMTHRYRHYWHGGGEPYRSGC